MKKTISIEIDTDNLRSVSDECLVDYWAIAQCNPASPFEDHDAGKIADCIGTEIIKRWLKSNSGSMYHHSEQSYYWKQLTKHCVFVSGQWVPRTMAVSPELLAEINAIIDGFNGGEYEPVFDDLRALIAKTANANK